MMNKRPKWDAFLFLAKLLNKTPCEVRVFYCIIFCNITQSQHCCNLFLYRGFDECIY